MSAESRVYYYFLKNPPLKACSLVGNARLNPKALNPKPYSLNPKHPRRQDAKTPILPNIFSMS